MSMFTGSGLVEQRCYNNRLQAAGVRVGTAVTTGCAESAGNADLLNLSFSYAAGQNNGNLSGQTIQYQGPGESFQQLTQNYVVTAYDGMNRLTSFSEGSAVSQSYGHDAYGNHWVPSSSGYSLSPLTPLTQNWFNPNNNRLVSAGYDARGNQTQINPYTMTYDGDDHQASAVSVSNGSASYEYDAEGHRVRKLTCTGNVACTGTSPGLATTVFVYDALGNLAAEYGGPANPLSGTTYLTSDHLGSTRMVTNSANPATVLARYDYAPFGEELTAGIDGRGAPYSANQYPTMNSDGTGEKFTSKERDAESGLDFFGARYMSAAQGRWTSPDLVNLTDDRILNPANTINKYIYGGNNPLKYTDPDGRDITVFYETGFPTGHMMLAAVNQQTNDFAVLSVGPVRHLDVNIMLHPSTGVPGTSEFQLPKTADDLRRNFAALTIQTSPEVAQQAINAIRNGAGTGNYTLFGNQCSSACAKVLQDVGLSPGSNHVAWTPSKLWANLYLKYGKYQTPRVLSAILDVTSFIQRPVPTGFEYGSPTLPSWDIFDFLNKAWNTTVEGCVSASDSQGNQVPQQCK
jgi:RHS repeat-associated protein